MYFLFLSLPQMVIRFFNIRDSLRLCEEFSPVHYYYIFWLTPLGGKQSETILMRLLLPPLPPPPYEQQGITKSPFQIAQEIALFIS